jgi:hypothetical protein
VLGPTRLKRTALGRPTPFRYTMRPGWNPTRRNRNIGTAKSGHGLANRMVIPESWNDPRVYWERLATPSAVEANGFTVLVEPCTDGFVHAATVDDVLRVLGLLPSEDIVRVRVVVLRQPTRKQRLQSCVWGRLAYFASFGEATGPAIILEAHPLNDVFHLPRSQTPDAAAELDRLRADGHTVTGERRSWRIETTLGSVRATQLFRTLPHEVGHYVQYYREVRCAANNDPHELDRLSDLFFTKPLLEKELFAHRYAREFYERAVANRRVPFARLVNAGSMKRFGLSPSWFGIPAVPNGPA